MVDYEILVDVAHYGTLDSSLERRYTCPALGLFYVRSNGDVVPIAIQLHQVPGDDNPIWTPNDSEYEWIYAKMWLRNADAQWHQVRFMTAFPRCINVHTGQTYMTCIILTGLAQRLSYWRPASFILNINSSITIGVF